MKIYYVERKNYFKGSDNIDYQFADGGELPLLYTSRKKAIVRAEEMAILYIDSFGYQLVISNGHMPCKNNGCIYGARLVDKKHGVRLEIRVYEMTTIN